MISLSDLKQFVSIKSDLSNLEYNLMYWLENKRHDNLDLTDKDILIGLNNYLDAETIHFWVSYLNESTKNIFLEADCSDYMRSLFLIKMQSMESVTGTLFVNEGSLFINSPLFATLLKKLDLNHTLSHSLTQVIQSVDINIIREFDVVVNLKDNALIITENGIQSNLEKYFLNTIQFIKAATTVSLLVASAHSYADNQSEIMEALQHSGKAIVKVDEVKTLIEANKVKIEQTSKKIQEENPNLRIPASVIGYGAKIINDGGIKLKSSTEVFEQKVYYQLLVGSETSISVTGKNPFAEKNSDYELIGTSNKLQVNMKWDINW